MPTIPSGGLSMFIHIFILLIGNFLQWLTRHGINSSRAYPFPGVFTGKESDGLWRRMMSWTIAGVIFLVLFVSTSVSIVHNVKQNLRFSIPDFQKINLTPYPYPMSFDGIAMLIPDRLPDKERIFLGEKMFDSLLLM